jgi:hypothetical protein
VQQQHQTMQILLVTKKLDFIEDGQLPAALRQHLGASQIVLGTPPSLRERGLRFTREQNDFKVIDENEILGFPLSSVSSWNVDGFPGRAGWYYQQLLKLGFARTALAQEKFLIWDADTIPTRKMAVFDGNTLLFTRGHELHVPYFETNRLLIGIDRMKGKKFSAISQHMPVDRALMLDMLKALDAKGGEGGWIAAIHQAIQGRTGECLFSEYELFADYVRSRHPSRSKLRSLPWLRQGAVLSDIEIAIARKLAWFISFEDWHKPDRAQWLNHLRCWKRFYLENY